MLPYGKPWTPKSKESHFIWEKIEYPARQLVQLVIFGVVSFIGIPKSVSLKIPYPAQHFDYKDRVEAEHDLSPHKDMTTS